MNLQTIIHGKDADYQIRLSDKEDLSSLPAVEAAAARLFSTTGYGYLAEMINPLEIYVEAQQLEHLWVVVSGAADVIGFAMISINGRRMHLEEIDIDPAHARQGLGRALISFLCDWAKVNGLDQVSLSTFRDVPWNAPYYARLGFSILPQSEWIADYFEIQKHEADLGLPIEQRVIMLKPL